MGKKGRSGKRREKKKMNKESGDKKRKDGKLFFQ
jgi:hypothetical protein